MNGIFVAIDGPNGSGKSTTASLLCESLEAKGVEVLLTKEPTGSKVGRMCHSEFNLGGALSYAALLAADRYAHLESEVAPALARGAVVISDRYVPSSLALQVLQGVPIDMVWALNLACMQPDLTVILLASPEILSERLDRRSRLSAVERSFTRYEECVSYARAVVYLKDKGWVMRRFRTDRIDQKRVVDQLAECVMRYLLKSC